MRPIIYIIPAALLIISLFALPASDAVVTPTKNPMASKEWVGEEWVARYNGPDNGDEYTDISFLIVDDSENVYVTGASWGDDTRDDYITIMYDSNGNELWVSRYNGPGNGSDYATAIALDNSGNVYVTGSGWVSDENCNDYTTIKYDSEGNELWVAFYNGPSNGFAYDFAIAMSVDDSGNVYVTGNSQGGETFSDYATVKYDSEGNELWVARYDSGSSDDKRDEAIALKLDLSGNVYVTGTSNYHYATIKYDSDGNELWIERYHGWASALDVDVFGNVYVTGWSWESGTYDDYATIKYDTEGTKLWVARYNSPDNGADGAYALLVDDSGNVYVTGYSYGSLVMPDYATIKYDSEGNELWVARYDGQSDDGAYALSVDGIGNVYVTGWSTSSDLNGDYATIKYDSEGNELWVARYDGPGNGNDCARAITVDRSGYVYVAGYSEGIGTGNDLVTIRYTQEVPCIDNDRDGYGSLASPLCPNPEEDCDDEDSLTYPGAIEICDGKDNDCDGTIPDDETDDDEDSWMLCEDDCDDTDPLTYPGAPDLCDGKDNDCDELIPDDEVDLDFDGWMICEGDCDDGNPAIHPDADEHCGDDIDNDCDGLIDIEDESDCPCTDTDGDGCFAETYCPCLDCDDDDSEVHPGHKEVPANGKDDDCDGMIDEPCFFGAVM